MGYKNPVMDLPAAKKLLALPADQREIIAEILTELRRESNDLAETNWRRKKGLIASYWRAVSTYSRHLAHAFRNCHRLN